jgi:dihydroflavonol-4-reductase
VAKKAPRPRPAKPRATGRSAEVNQPVAPLAEETQPAAPPRAVHRRIVITGGAGFVGSAVCRVLHERGDHVVALVRDPGRAGRLREMAAEGLELIQNDLSDVTALADVLRDADAVIHAAGSYRVGILRSERGAMWDANVGTTTRILDAAEDARVPRIVYVSTVGVFGNTNGEVVDEKYRRDLHDGFLSWYDETKYGAHEVAEQRQAAGAPIVIVQPSQVYGPGDHTSIGEQLRLAAEGGLRYQTLSEVGLGFVHIDDLAAGIVAALDNGATGESYVLSGPTVRVREAIALAAATRGRRPPSLAMPTGLLRRLAPVGRLLGQSNLREVISSSAGVTYWASAAKAERELGFRARDLETGFRDTFGGPPASPPASTY